MMKYRFGLLALLFGTSAGLLAGRGVDAQTPPAAATRSLSIATLAPSGSTWMRVLESWGREVRRRSNKSLSLNFYPGGVQGDEAEVIRKIRAGRLDGAAVTGVGLAQIHRPALVFQFPGMFPNYAALDNTRAALNTEMTTAFAGAGFRLMGWADVGVTHMFSNTAIHTPADVRAVRPWLWRDDSVFPAFYEEVHATGVQLQVPEVLSALQTHRIDTFVTSPVAALALQWNSHATHMNQVDCSVSIGATVFGRRQLEALTPEQQALLNETAGQFHRLLVQNLRRDETSALARLGTGGITMVPVTDAERAQWRDAFRRTRQRLTGRIADAAFIARVEGLAH